MKLIKRPIRLSFWKRTLKVSISQVSINLSAVDRFSKKTAVTTDIVPVLLELADAEMDLQDKLIKNNCNKGAISFVGIARALTLLRYTNPDVYRKFIDVAKLLSFEVENEEKIPVLAFFSVSSYVKEAFEILKKKHGVSLDTYLLAVIDAFKKHKLISEIALFSSNKEKDREEIVEFLTERKRQETPFPEFFMEFADVEISKLELETSFLDENYEKILLEEVDNHFGNECFGEGNEGNERGTKKTQE